MVRGRRNTTTTRVEPYKHPEADSAMRPEVGTQARFKKKKPPQTYRYDSSIDDEDMTREPEMVQAYRDTWELGLHSYLTYLRDRLYLAHDLLAPSGSIFVQISDENLHHVREVMDEVFGKENFVSQITFQTTSGFETTTIASLGDFLLWYPRDIERVKVRQLFEEQPAVPGEGNARWIPLADGTYRGVSAAERRGEASIPEAVRLYKPDNLQGQGAAKAPQPFEFEGKSYEPGASSHWKANYPTGMERLAEVGRIHVTICASTCARPSSLARARGTA